MVVDSTLVSEEVFVDCEGGFDWAIGFDLGLDFQDVVGNGVDALSFVEVVGVRYVVGGRAGFYAFWSGGLAAAVRVLS